MSSYLPFGIQQSAGHIKERPELPSPSAVKPIAFYLPQFHPTAVNDTNWGEGFTEWRNVTRAQVEFTDHYQPRAPANYGFYDLRLPEIQVRQAKDAKAAGLAAFAYYYYWFDGEQPLLAPLINHRDNPEIDLEYCLCFANENWTKSWDGLDDEIIYEQKYGDNFAKNFWSSIEPFLKSGKYLKDSRGRPIFLVYRPSIIPQFGKIADIWRQLAKDAGFPGLYLVGGLGFETYPKLTKGLDGYYEFPPLNSFPRSTFGPLPAKEIVHGQYLHSRTRVHDYRQYVMMERLVRSSPPTIYPCVMPGWDNVARRPFSGNAFSDALPDVFEEWTRLATARAYETTEGLLFINAWNEWAEGAYLEPDLRYGWANLAAFSRGLEAASAAPRVITHHKPVAFFIHAHYTELWDEISSRIAENVNFPFHVIATTSSDAELPRPRSDNLQEFEIHRLENRGRDILPFLIALEKTELDFDIAVKLHTKRSLHRVDGAVWRQMLFSDLVPADGCRSFVSLFQDDPNIGFICPEDHWAQIGEHIGSNLKDLREVSRRLGQDFSHRDLETGKFIAGSMFWFRRSALCGISPSDVEDLFIEEAGQLDGTAAHAFERLFSLLGERNAYVTVTSGQVEKLLRKLRIGDYPLGERMRMFSDQSTSLAHCSRIALSRVDKPASVLQDRSAPRDGMLGRAEQFQRFVARNEVALALYKRLPPAVRVRLRKTLRLR